MRSCRWIGVCDGGCVFFVDGVVKVVGANVMIFGCKSREDAIEAATRNLKGFEKYSPSGKKHPSGDMYRDFLN